MVVQGMIELFSFCVQIHLIKNIQKQISIYRISRNFGDSILKIERQI